VVGAGSSGCAVAARLAERLLGSVGLVEAGPDTIGDLTPRKNIKGLIWKHDWGFKSESTGALGRSIRLPRGKLVGGCSATNLGLAMRPPKEDFLQWPQKTWAWEAVLPYFRRLENDVDFTNDFHGNGGPIRVAREPRERWVETQRAFFDTCAERGERIIPDLNNFSERGVGACPLNSVDGSRASSADGYLTPERRKALTVISNTEVSSIIIENLVATGLMAIDRDGRAVRIDASQAVVLAAGAIGTPVLLMRSGIGPARHLENVGLPVIVDLPGVGQGVKDHPCLTVTCALKPGVGHKNDPLFQTMLLANSGLGLTADAFDLHLLPRSSSPRTHNLPSGQLAFFIFVALVSPLARGQILLRSSAPNVPPKIDPNYLGEPIDRQRMSRGLEIARRILAAPALRRLIDFEISPGSEFQESSGEAPLSKVTGSYYHLSGGCRLGPADMKDCVADEHLRVLGVERLYVADASVFPEIPRANTHLAAVMIGERCADFLETSG